jgi:hypothetical protein
LSVECEADILKGMTTVKPESNDVMTGLDYCLKNKMYFRKTVVFLDGTDVLCVQNF